MLETLENFDDEIKHFIMAELVADACQDLIRQLYVGIVITKNSVAGDYIAKAYLQCRLNNYNEAIRILGLGAEKFKKLSSYYLASKLSTYAGVVHRHFDQLHTAEKSFRYAVSLDNNNIHALMYLGNTLDDMSRFREALDTFDKVISFLSEPNLPMKRPDILLRAFNNKAMTAYRLARQVGEKYLRNPLYQDALGSISKGLKICHDQVERKFMLHTKSLIQYSLNDYEGALQSANLALEIDKTYVLAMYVKYIATLARFGKEAADKLDCKSQLVQLCQNDPNRVFHNLPNEFRLIDDMVSLPCFGYIAKVDKIAYALNARHVESHDHKKLDTLKYYKEFKDDGGLRICVFENGSNQYFIHYQLEGLKGNFLCSADVSYDDILRKYCGSKAISDLKNLIMTKELRTSRKCKFVHTGYGICAAIAEIVCYESSSTNIEHECISFDSTGAYNVIRESQVRGNNTSKKIVLRSKHYMSALRWSNTRYRQSGMVMLAPLPNEAGAAVNLRAKNDIGLFSECFEKNQRLSVVDWPVQAEPSLFLMTPDFKKQCKAIEINPALLEAVRKKFSDGYCDIVYESSQQQEPGTIFLHHRELTFNFAKEFKQFALMYQKLSNKNVTCIKVVNCVCTPDELVNFFRVLKGVSSDDSLVSLESVKVSHSELTDEHVRMLCGQLVNFPIRKINLSHNRLTMASSDAIRELVSRSPALQSLNLSYNRFFIKTAEKMEELVDNRLAKINLASNELYFEAHELDAIRGDVTLAQNRVVNVSGNFISDSSRSALGKYSLFKSNANYVVPSLFAAGQPNATLRRGYSNVAFCRGQFFGHASIWIERMESNGQVNLICCELKYDKGVRVTKRSFRDPKRFLQDLRTNEKYLKTFLNIPDSNRNVDKLLNKVGREESEGVDFLYSRVGDSSASHSKLKSDELEYHNCVTWCVDKLLEYKIMEESEASHYTNWFFKTIPGIAVPSTPKHHGLKKP